MSSAERADSGTFCFRPQFSKTRCCFGDRGRPANSHAVSFRGELLGSLAKLGTSDEMKDVGNLGILIRSQHFIYY